MPKLRHYDNLGTSRFITFSCYHHQQLLNDDKIKQIFIDHLNEIRNKYNVKIYGYVIMPDHIHLLLHPPDNLELGKVIGYLKGLTSRSALDYLRSGESKTLKKLQTMRNGRLQTAFWQKRCYDHNCRTSQTTLEKIEYCHKNPVVRGLVKSQEDWRWSSYNWYLGAEDVPLVIDELEL
jgi:putative transposase